MSRQIGEDIRALRKSRSLTLKDLALSIGRSLGWLSQIERGQTVPPVRDLGLIVDYFGISISFFPLGKSVREGARSGSARR